MLTNLEPRTRRFFQGALLVLIPAALIIPATAFFTICPPGYARSVFLPLLAVFTVSEIFGLIRLFGCLSRKLDSVVIGAILCFIMSFLVLGFTALGLLRTSW